MIRFFIKSIPIILLLISSILPVAQAQRESGIKKNNVRLEFIPVDKDSLFLFDALKLQRSFNSIPQAYDYLKKLPATCMAIGYPALSIDKIVQNGQVITIDLFVGPRYNHLIINPGPSIPNELLLQSGYSNSIKSKQALDMRKLPQIQEALLSHYENHGYPFAEINYDSIRINGDTVFATLQSNKGIFYRVDSIRVIGNVKLNKKFLARYLDIPTNSIYNKEKLYQVDKRISQLPYVTAMQNSDQTLLGSGAILNLYLQPRKSSQFNFLVGFMPANTQTGKLQVIADVNLDLKNMFGSGESILVKWQQLQPKSPRLNLVFNYPYAFNSVFGFDMFFDLFKKDSNFLQLNALVGADYIVSANRKGKLYIQWHSTSLLPGAIDTNQIKLQKKLPDNVDEKAVNIGLNYHHQQTNNVFNPRRGYDWYVQTTVGIKNILKNSEIMEIKDPGFDYGSLYDSIEQDVYQLRLKFSGSYFLPIGKSSTLKTALQAGIYSSPEIFRNDLFQIGGFKLMRGFDEESIYATQYAVLTAEYRNLIDRNSFLYLFLDAGYSRAKYQKIDNQNFLIAAGIGLSYETKFGLLNISYALGKRDDVRFNLREASKLHFGYINYF